MIILFSIFIFVFVGSLIFGKKENPYIKTHKRKWRNTEYYQEYLKWLDSKGGDVPLNEIKFKEDVEAMNEVSKHIKK